jgi:hypothetical protein
MWAPIRIYYMIKMNHNTNQLKSHNITKILWENYETILSDHIKIRKRVYCILVYYIIPHPLNISQQYKMQVLGQEGNLVGFKEWRVLFNKELVHSDILPSADCSQQKKILIGCRQHIEMHVSVNQFRKIDSQSTR